jgi:asparagine synthase (glutamine-hydrolysing)
MCGIAGILRFEKDIDYRKKTIESMISTLYHRGPDGWGYYISSKIALGHTRLSIIDLSGGNQPMISDRYVLVYNGEIYNYIEIRDELIKRGVLFSTKSDTEVVLKSFEIFGTEALTKFNGQFAFLLWDKLKENLLIARDRYGIRPLYILSHNNSYYFASEIKAFDTINGYHRSFNLQNLFEHALFWNTLDDSTVFENIRSLPGGTYEIYQYGKSPIKFRYYEIGERQNRFYSPDDDGAVEEFTELLEDSVKLRLRSDVPVANYLSGGIDSSVVTHLTARHNNRRFKTFSVAFEDKDFDESYFQKEMVTQVNSEHIQKTINYKLIDENFLDAVYHFERPVFRTAPIPLYLLSKEVRAKGIKVVLTGEAADEVLYGYDSYKELKFLEFWKKSPNSKLRPLLLKKLYPHLKHFRDPRQFSLIKMFYEGFLDDFQNELAGLNIRTHNNLILFNYFNKDHKLSFKKEKLIESIKRILPDNYDSWSLLQKNQFLEMKTLLSGYLLSSQGDRMSMAHSVESRYPFLDHRIVEKLFYYPDNIKLRGFSQKHLLKEAFKDSIPASIIERPKMPYQAPDLKSFFRNNKLSEIARFFLSANMLNNHGIFDPKFVNRLIKKYTDRDIKLIGYRDNMLITFILSTQMAAYWINRPKKHKLDERLKKVQTIDT